MRRSRELGLTGNGVPERIHDTGSPGGGFFVALGKLIGRSGSTVLFSFIAILILAFSVSAAAVSFKDPFGHQETPEQRLKRIGRGTGAYLFRAAGFSAYIWSTLAGIILTTTLFHSLFPSVPAILFCLLTIIFLRIMRLEQAKTLYSGWNNLTGFMKTVALLTFNISVLGSILILTASGKGGRVLSALSFGSIRAADLMYGIPLLVLLFAGNMQDVGRTGVPGNGQSNNGLYQRTLIYLPAIIALILSVSPNTIGSRVIPFMEPIYEAAGGNVLSPLFIFIVICAALTGALVGESGLHWEAETIWVHRSVSGHIVEELIPFISLPLLFLSEADLSLPLAWASGLCFSVTWLLILIAKGQECIRARYFIRGFFYLTGSLFIFSSWFFIGKHVLLRRAFLSAVVSIGVLTVLIKKSKS